eukprot:scaffold449_cov184-Amphora_coffeaeformis.AAC.9
MKTTTTKGKASQNCHKQNHRQNRGTMKTIKPCLVGCNNCSTTTLLHAQIGNNRESTGKQRIQSGQGIVSWSRSDIMSNQSMNSSSRTVRPVFVAAHTLATK